MSELLLQHLAKAGLLLQLPAGHNRRPDHPLPIRPLVVSPAVAAAMLAVSKPSLYDLLAKAEIKSYKDGKYRKVLVSSLEDYVARKQQSG
jgi:excisionase family DNA binding protein